MDAELERAAIRANLAAIRFQLAGYRLILALRYNPNWHLQPRVPAGRPEGGQWTRIAFLAEGGDPIRLAQGDRLQGYPVDLREEERRGGHAIREHVGKSHRFLMERVRRESVGIIERGDLFSGLAVGSFSSLDAATRLVNATLARHQSIVASVARGELPQALVRVQFGSVTGYEAYLPTFHSQPYIRETYGAAAFIVHDPASARGFHLRTAYPIR